MREGFFSNSLPKHMQLTVQIYTIANPEGRVNDLISQLKIQYHMIDIFPLDLSFEAYIKLSDYFSIENNVIIEEVQIRSES